MSLQSIVSANCHSLLEIKSQLSELPEQLYTLQPELTAGSIGVHVRHILEHYHMLLAGLSQGVICYDDRIRSEKIEQSLSIALSTLTGITSHLQTLIPEGDRPLTLKAVVSGNSAEQVCTETTLVRELIFIHSHTIHHQAIVSVLLKAESIEVSDDFGVAPATLKFRQQASPGSR